LASPTEGSPVGSNIARGIATVPWYPVVFGATYVLSSWIESGVSFYAVWRALLVVVVGLVLVLGIGTVVTRRPHPVAAITLFVFAIVSTRGTRDLLAVSALGLAIPAAIYLYARVRRATVSWPDATRAVNVLCLLIFAVTVAGGVPRGTYSALSTDLRQGADSLSVVGETDSGRDVLVLLLDAYPRADVVDRRYGGSGEQFGRALETRGFEVFDGSESNYPWTQATLTSMFYMRPLDEIASLRRVTDGSLPAYPTMRDVLNTNPVFELFRARGYAVVAFSPGFEHVTLRQSDVFIDNGSLNEAERHLIRGTVIQGVIDAIAPHALADQYRQRILAAFDAFEKIATWQDKGAMLAFVHVPSPHMPVVLDANGDLLAEPPGAAVFRSDPLSDTARDVYLGQLEYLDERTLRAVDEAIAEGRGQEPIIVVMSDHGAPLPPGPGESWTSDHYANLLAIRAPSDMELSLDEDLTPVNLFAALAEPLFGAQLDRWPNERLYWRAGSGTSEPLGE
jgi:hypothetical protein